MPGVDQSNVNNVLLGALAPESFARFAPHLNKTDLPVKRVLVEVNEPIADVCFLESGLASMIATSEDGESVEIGHIGREGMTGEHIVLMSSQTPNKTFMQAAGDGYLMSAEVFSDILKEDMRIQELFLRYVQSCELQLAHSSLANARYNVHERLARWLLMVHDRIVGDDLPLTHEFLGLMLGVRRSGVTEQIHLMEGIHAIKATRGNVRILDRAILRDIAEGCYGIPEREYERLIGQPGRLKGRS